MVLLEGGPNTQKETTPFPDQEHFFQNQPLDLSQKLPEEDLT